MKSSTHRRPIIQCFALLCALAVVVPAFPQEQRPPLTLAQIEQLIAAGTPDEAVAGEVNMRGIAFSPTSLVLGALRQKGAGPRTLISLEKLVCFVAGHDEHPLNATDSGGYKQVKDLLQTKGYQTESVTLLEKPQLSRTCTVLVIGGPHRDYIGSEIDVLKRYVEDGGRALFLLDPSLKIGPEPVSDNAALIDLLATWGVTADENLLLDESAASQSLGGGPEVPVVMQYDSHPIVNNLANTSTAFPLSRSLETKNTDKTTITKLFSTSADSFATNNLSSEEIRIDPAKDKRGPFTLAAAGTYHTGKPTSQGRFIVVGNSAWASNKALGFTGNRALFLNMMNWLASAGPL